MNVRCYTNGSIINGSNSPSVNTRELRPREGQRLVMATGPDTLNIAQPGLTCPWGHSVM